MVQVEPTTKPTNQPPDQTSSVKVISFFISLSLSLPLLLSADSYTNIRRDRVPIFCFPQLRTETKVTAAEYKTNQREVQKLQQHQQLNIIIM